MYIYSHMYKHTLHVLHTCIYCILTYIQTQIHTYTCICTLSFVVLDSVWHWIWHKISLWTKCLVVFHLLFHCSVTCLHHPPPLPLQVTEWWDLPCCSQLLPIREQKNWNLRFLWMLELYSVDWKFKNIDFYSSTRRTFPQSELTCNSTGWAMDNKPYLSIIGTIHADSGKLLVINAVAGISPRRVGVCPGCPLRDFPMLRFWLWYLGRNTLPYLGIFLKIVTP